MNIDVYKDIAKRLWDEVEELAWIDLWSNQLANEAKEYPIIFPAVFLNFQSLEDTYLHYGLIEVIGTLTTVVVCENYEDHYKSSNKNINEHALNFMNFKDRVTKALNGYRTEVIKSLYRKRQRLSSELTNLYVVELDFDISYYDLVNVNNDYIERNPLFEYEKKIVQKIY